MQEIGKLIRKLRKEKGYPLRKVAAWLDIDQAILSKMERGQRKITKEQVIRLARFFHYDEREMLITYLSDLIVSGIGEEELAGEALKVAEEKIAYKTFQALDRKKIIQMIKNTLKRFPKIRTAWIYGSFARGDDTPDSDIDLAIRTEGGFSYFDLAEIQHQLEKEINLKIDIGFIDSFKPGIFRNLQPDLKLIYEKET